MMLPPLLQKKYIARFIELIEVGEMIAGNITTISGRRHQNFVTGEYRKDPDKHVVDWEAFSKWRTNCISLLSLVIPQDHVHQSLIKNYNKLSNSGDHVRWGLAAMKGLKEDLEKDLLGDLVSQVESSVAADYMGQAEKLLKEGQSEKFDHVPAAVLAGAVLEKILRTLCNQQQPPILTIKANGESKTLNPLIDDLKKAGLFNEAKAKQLRSWADTRNHAAHGEFDQFTRNDVDQMLTGVNNFLADYLK
jgi:hypothetical protein